MKETVSSVYAFKDEDEQAKNWPTLASSSLPRAFNKFPRSDLTQYKSWNKCRSVSYANEVKARCFYSQGCTEGRTRRTGLRPPCRRQPPRLRPGLCSHRWSLAWAWRRVCSCPAPPEAGPALWTRCQDWSRPRPASGSVWWPEWRNELTWEWGTV